MRGWTLLALLGLGLFPQSSWSLLSCSGYLKADFPVDLSLVSVGLFTEHGSRRDATACAPTSGYFFLPVEDKGNYRLKVKTKL